MDLAEQIRNALGVSPSLLLAHIIAVTILFILLYFLLWKKAVKFLEERNKKIRTDIDNAANSNREAQDLVKKMEVELSDTHSKADDILGSAKKAANVQRTHIISKATKDADELIVNAKIMIATEQRSNKQTQEQESVLAAYKIAKSILNREVSDKDQDEFLNSFIDDLDEE